MRVDKKGYDEIDVTVGLCRVFACANESRRN